MYTGYEVAVIVGFDTCKPLMAVDWNTELSLELLENYFPSGQNFLIIPPILSFSSSFPPPPPPPPPQFKCLQLKHKIWP